MNALLPTDDEVRREGAPRLRAALRRMGEPDPDILYSGPVAARLRELLPAPAGVEAPPPNAHEVRRPAGPTVFLLDDRERPDASVRVILPPVAENASQGVAALVFDAYTQTAMFETGFRGHNLLGTSPDARSFPPMHGVVVPCDPDEVPRAVEVAMGLLRRRPDRSMFHDAHGQVEAAFRAERVAAAEIPARVRSWNRDVDPRVALWLALPGLSHEAFLGFVDTLAAVSPIITIAADTSRIDPEALADLGEVVRVDPSRILRDAYLYEIGREDPAIAIPD